MSDLNQLTEQLKATLGEARTIASTAERESRDFTKSEQSHVDSLLAKGRGLKADITRAKAEQDSQRDKQRQGDAEMKAFLADLGQHLGDDSGGNAGRGTVTGSKWATSVATKAMTTAREHGVKALVTGSIDVPNPVESLITLPAEPTRLLDLIPRKPLTGNTFEYPVQTARTNNAAPVADGGLKPTSVYTVEDREDRARVFAHLSEAIPERLLADHAELARMLDTQMREDLFVKLEANVTSGDGTGENFTGLLNTTGTLSVAFATDMLTTIRKARTAMGNVNQQPTAWVFNPADLEAIDLMRESGTSGGFLVNTSSLANIFGPYARVSSTGVPAGTAILGDFRQARLYVREDARLDADRSGTLFQKNQVQLRVEGRFGFAVLRPNAFAEVDLAA